MKVKQVNAKQVIVGTVISEVAVAAFPQLRPLVPFSRGASAFLAGILLAKKLGLLRR